MWLNLCSTSDSNLADRGGRVKIIDDHCNGFTPIRCLWKHASPSAAEPEAAPLKDEPQAAE
jgi:hypothetical protein